jgi:hypothetical protein
MPKNFEEATQPGSTDPGFCAPKLTGDCETDCQTACAYPGMFSECAVACVTCNDAPVCPLGGDCDTPMTEEQIAWVRSQRR